MKSFTHYRSITAVITATIFSVAGCKKNQPEGTPPPPPGITSESPRPVDARTVSHTDSSAPTSNHDAGSTGSATGPAPAAASEFRETGQWLPQGTVGEYQQRGSVSLYTPSNMAERIDGAAELYIRYGVRKMAATDYAKPGTTFVLKVELYEFDAPLGAYGYFSHMIADGRDPSELQSQAITRGGGGFQGSSALAFWKGTVLVKLELQDTSDNATEAGLFAQARVALPAMAEAIDRLLPGTTTQPTSPLPTENLVWGGQTYYPEQVLGVENTGPGWVGHYRNGSDRYRLAVLSLTSPEQTQQAFRRFRTGTTTPVPNVGEEAFTATIHDDNITVARARNFVVAITEEASPDPSASPDAGTRAPLSPTQRSTVLTQTLSRLTSASPSATTSADGGR